MEKTKLLFLLMVLFSVFSCRNEGFYSEKTSQQNREFSYRIVDKKDIPGIINFVSVKTDNFKIPLKQTTVLNKTETAFGEVNTDYIIEAINEKNETYYVFSIIPSVESGSDVYNLEVRSEGDAPQTAKIMVYLPSEDWVLNGNGNFSVFSGKVKVYSEDGDLESSTSYFNGAGDCDDDPCPDCPGPANPPGNPGNGNGGNGGPPPPGGGNPPTGTGGPISYPDPGSPGNPAPGDPGTTSGGLPCYWKCIFDENGDCTMMECIEVVNPSRLMDPCSGSGMVNQAPQKTPCERVKKSTNDDKYKSNITTLKGKTGDSYESGFRLGNPVPGSGQSGTQSQLLQNRPGTKEVNMAIFSSTFAIMHTHYDGIYPIFSPGDILFFNQWIVWANNWNAIPTNTPKISLNDLTLTVVTSDGNYLLSFDGTDVGALPNYTQKEFDNLNKNYEKRLNETHTNGNFDMDKVEKEFLKFVKDKMNMSGLKLFKVGSNDTNTEIYLENGNRKTKQCP